MSGARVCITNAVADLRSCTVRGSHRSNCDGWAYRYDPATQQTRAAYRMEWNPDLRRNERILIECAGCLPREAEVGLLCESHAAKVRHALETEDDGTRIVIDLALHLWATEAAAVSDGNDRIASAYGSRWPLSESRVVANEMLRALDLVAFAIGVDLELGWQQQPGTSARHGLEADASLVEVGRAFVELLRWLEDRWQEAASHAFTAEAIVRSIDTISTALHRFPLADSVHRIPAVRCQSCGRMSLEWRPPLFHLDEVIVECDACGHRTDQDYVSAYVEAVRTDPRRLAR